MIAVFLAYALAIATVALFALCERIHNHRADARTISRRVRGLRR